MVGIVINRLWALCCATVALMIFVPIVRTQQVGFYWEVSGSIGGQITNYLFAQPLAGGEAALNSTEINHRNADYGKWVVGPVRCEALFVAVNGSGLQSTSTTRSGLG